MKEYSFVPRCYFIIWSRKIPRYPKYLKIKEWLVECIANGELAQGSKLPSEHELMERFEVSRVTARQAINHLHELGLIESQQGKGHFVKRLKAIHNLERLQSFGEMMMPFGVETSSDVIELIEIPASQNIANALQIQVNDPVTRIVRRRLAGGATVSLDISYFPLQIGRKIQTLDLTHKDIFLLMENSVGIALGYSDLEIDAVPVKDIYTSYLGVEKGDNIIRIRRLTHDINGKPIDYEYIYTPLDSMQFRLRVARW